MKVIPVNGYSPLFPEYFYMRQFIADPTAPGLEIGAAAHNPYWSALTNCLNVAPDDDADFEIYKQEQIRLSGAYMEIDLKCEGDDLPVDSGSQHYIISSHSFEHLPNPIKALKEWDRVLVPNGVVVLVIPLRNALPSDSGRPIITLDRAIDAYERDVTVEIFQPTEDDPSEISRRGHYYVYNMDAVKRLVEYACPHWECIGAESSDSKVGNGFTLVFKTIEVPKPIGDTIDDGEGGEFFIADVVVEETPKPKRGRKKTQ